MIEKITKSALALREFIALFVVCFLILGASYWIGFVWWPTEIHYKNEFAEILKTTNERLRIIEQNQQRKK